MLIQKPTGTKDILPDEQKYWQFLFAALEKRAKSFGCQRIDTPLFEYQEIYTRGIGETTDIVEKEMYEVRHLGNTHLEEGEKNPLVLRPEFTAGIMRSYLENGMQTWPQPIRLYSYGPVFRYDRPQRGRYRQFFQLNLEIIGDDDPLTDALTIMIGWQILLDCGLKNQLVLDINSIGCKICRPKIKKGLTEYFGDYGNALCPNCSRRLQFNPLRILDCKEEQCQKIIAAAPQTIDNLCPDCKNHFMKVLEYLDELNINYDLNTCLVRGLDYYTRTTFEYRDVKDSNRQSSLGGGGRYDNLLELFGGKPTPSVGWAMGCERIIEKIKENKLEITESSIADIFVIQIGDKAKKKASQLISLLGDQGYNVSAAFGKDSLKSQLKAADKMRARYALIIGQREALDNTAIVRDMESGSQETIPIDKLSEFLKKKLIHS